MWRPTILKYLSAEMAIVYADNGCHARLSRCKLETGNMAVIQNGNSSVVLEDVEAECGQVGFMLHGGMPESKDTGIIRVQNSKLTSKQEMFRCKSTNVDIYVAASELTAENGVLLRAMTTDDAFYHRNRARGAACYEGCTLDGVYELPSGGVLTMAERT